MGDNCDVDLIKEACAKVRRVGRPSIHETNPIVVEAVKRFIEQSTAGAHLRRRSSDMYTNGVTLREIADYVKVNYDISISKDTIHRMLLPPRKNTIASRQYKSLIPVRIPPKRNDAEKNIHPDYHYTSAQVSLVNQLAELCKDNSLRLSVDNKNKIEIGNPAVNRRCQVRKFHLVGDGPTNWDHDFPYWNMKLTPSGYQKLCFRLVRSRSLSPPRKDLPVLLRKHRRSLSVPCKENFFGSAKTSKDRVGRVKMDWLRTGPSHVQLYPCRTIESTSVMHVHFLLNHVRNIMKEQLVYNVISIADGGPDWSVKGIINLMTFGYMWKELKIDTLIVQCYAPGHSRLNPIERTWSNLTKLLVGVLLPVEIAELDHVIPKENDNAGWSTVLDNAVKECSKFWDGKEHDGFKITATQFLCNDPNVPRLKQICNLLREFADAGKKKLN